MMDLYDLQVHVPDFSFFILSLNIAETNLRECMVAKPKWDVQRCLHGYVAE